MKIKILKGKILEDFKLWSIWSCGISEFDWTYKDEEHCFIIEGNVTVKGTENTVNIKSGDYVIFPKGLRCTWIVHESIKKYYSKIYQRY